MNEVAKSQWVRLWDVVGLSPLMIYIGLKNGKLKNMDRQFLIGAGFLTLFYNLRNLIADRDIPTEPYSKVPLGISSVYQHSETSKRMGNAMRLVDVFAYGPMMLKIGAQNKMEPWEEIFMYVGGVMTVFVNGMNYLANRNGVT